MTDVFETSADRAEFYGEITTEAKAQPGTTFTDDAVFDATTRLVEVLTAQLLAASHIRATRPKRRRILKL